MYTKKLRFLANLLFKQYYLRFLTPPKPKRTRTPKRWLRCAHCGFHFSAFTHRQIVCKSEGCIKARRKLLYDARQERKDKAEYAKYLDERKGR
ncbi:hypothetical protein LCGC14_2450750 [marine sediment metagenome]|uniref:Uncharacterized protein n=1 Tax=marine sediment metagenome TaxID=412755 RepID=A0A0F9DTB0_9ZZZZ